VVGIVEVDQSSTTRFSHQVSQYLLPDLPALVLQQSSITGLVGSLDIMRHVFPMAASVQYVQDAVDYLSLVCSGSSPLLGFG